MVQEVCSCGCGRSVMPHDGRGRPTKYFSGACRVRAHRRNKPDVTKIDVPVTKIPDIQFYCGINARSWAHHSVAAGPLACIAPMYGARKDTKQVNTVTVPDEVQAVLVDSAAFSDKTDERLSFQDALHRQIGHAYRFGYAERVSHLASYDLLIDEKWQDGERSKIRWTRSEASVAVQETVEAAHYLAGQRRFLRGVFGRPVGLALSAQGVEIEQYIRCASQIIPLMEEGDIFGLGGWCITGLLPDAIFPSFCEIMSEVIPYLGLRQIKRVHIWGVIFPEALGYLLYLCDQVGIQLSTDSSGPSRYPTLGQWGYGSWRDPRYKKPSVLASCKVKDEQGRKIPTCLPGTFCQGLERARHVQLTREWLAHFRERELGFYHPVVKPAYQQLSWMEVAS